MGRWASDTQWDTHIWIEKVGASGDKIKKIKWSNAGQEKCLSAQGI